jgi:DNA-binding beta-propeller fold protein YncE
VTDSANQRVVKVGTGGALLTSWQYGPDRPGNAASLAIDGSGRLHLANSADNTVSVFSPSGTLLHRKGGFHGLRAIAIDPHGNEYLAENQTHRITERAPNGKVIKQWDTHTLWNGGSAGNPTGLAVGPGGAIEVSTRCIVESGVGSSCARRISYLSGSTGALYSLVSVLLPLRAGALTGDARGLVSLGQKSAGLPPVPRDQCNNRFVRLDAIARGPNGIIDVAGILWPRTSAVPFLAVGIGPGEPGCSHDGIGPGWTVYPTPTGATIHGLAVDPAGNLYLSQGQRIWTLSPAASARR